MGATADAGGRNKTKEAQVAQKGALQQQGEAHRAALMEQAEAAAAKLKELMAELAGTWVSPLAETEPRVVALAARLVPAAECLETVRESGARHSSAELRKGTDAASRSTSELCTAAHDGRAKVSSTSGRSGKSVRHAPDTRGCAVTERI